MAIKDDTVRRMPSAETTRTCAPSMGMSLGTSLGILFVVLVVMMGTACSQGYKEKVIPAKEFTPLERARTMLEGYAAGNPVGSDFMGFELLREELRSKNVDQSGILGEAFTQIEKAMMRPAEVKAIAQRTLAELNKQSAPAQ
jgi:hypothetical protein